MLKKAGRTRTEIRRHKRSAKWKAEIAFQLRQSTNRQVTFLNRELKNGFVEERWLNSQTIFRNAAEGAELNSSLSVALGGETARREVTLEIDNGDSPPLYDVARLTAGKNIHEPPSLKFEPLETNSSYSPPEALLGTRLVGGALDPFGWKYERTVTAPEKGVYEIELDGKALAHSKSDFSDARIISQGHQIPYLLERTHLIRETTLEIASPRGQSPKHVSRWEIKIPGAQLPLQSLEFASPTKLFSRTMRLFENVPDERGELREMDLAQGHWAQLPDQPGNPFTLRPSRRPLTDLLILETDDGQNSPIEITSAKGSLEVARLIFKMEDSGPIKLIYGNPSAGLPGYDLNLVAPQMLAAPKHSAQLGPEVGAKAGIGLEFGLKGKTGLVFFWAALSAVVVGLLIVVARLLPKPSPSTPSE